MYFFDTYALVKIVQGDQNYANFLAFPIYTSILNQLEFLYHLLKDNEEEKAMAVYRQLNLTALPAAENDAIAAAKFRLANKGKNMSYIDCMGYNIAKSNGLVFLTGDRAFEGMENVEFVR